MIVIYIFIFLVIIYLIYYFSQKNIEFFENTFPLLKSYKCMASNKKIINFVNKFNNIFDKYKIKTGEIEASVKFSVDEINVGRFVAFIPYEYIENYPKLKDECYKTAAIPNEVKVNIDKKLDSDNYSKAQLLFGIDNGEESTRVYLNVIDKNNIDKGALIGYNIQKNVIAKKIYKKLKIMEFKTKCASFIGPELYNKLLNAFPVDLWGIVGCKNDSRIDNVNYSSFYINLNFEYKLSQFGTKLFNLLEEVYKGKRVNLDKFYECYKNNNITWIALGKNALNEVEFSIYFVYNRNLRTKVDTEKILKLKNSLKKLKEVTEKMNRYR